jgi:EmrB/QacA subfamily drug resistance transporter
VTERSNPSPELLQSKKWGIFGVMMIGWAMSLLDVSIVNITIPELQRDLSTDIETASWVANAYNIAFGVVLITMGRLADQFGRKRLFIIGMIVFTVFSAACAAAWTVESLIVFRIFQGIGAGILAPLGFAMTVMIFPPAERGRGLALIAVVALVMAALGPVLGGLLIEIATWHWVFLINIPFGILGIVLCLRIWPETYDLNAPRHVDYLGMLLLGLGGFCAAYGLTEANERGWDDALILFLLQAAVFLFVGFFASQRFGKHPMMTHGIMDNKQFMGANGAMFVFAMGALGSLFLLSLIFINLWGYEPLEAGLALAAVPIAGLVAWPIVGKAADTRQPRQIARPALLISALGLIWVSFLPSTAETSGDYLVILPGLLMFGFGMGMVFPAINVGAMGAVQGQELGLASGLLNTSRQVGAGFGIALLVAIMVNVGEDRVEWAKDEIKDVNDLAELPDQMAFGLMLRSFADFSGQTELRFDKGPGFDDISGRIAADAAAQTYGWAFRGAALFLLLAIPLCGGMIRTPQQAMAEAMAAAKARAAAAEAQGERGPPEPAQPAPAAAMAASDGEREKLEARVKELESSLQGIRTELANGGDGAATERRGLLGRRRRS